MEFIVAKISFVLLRTERHLHPLHSHLHPFSDAVKRKISSFHTGHIACLRGFPFGMYLFNNLHVLKDLSETLLLGSHLHF
jgi:hypothetical protein